VASPKFFAIYIEDLAKIIDETGLGIQVEISKINIMMYADDVIVVAITRDNLPKQQDVVGQFGDENGIKFNQLNLILF